MSDRKKQYKKPPSTFGNVKRIKNDLAHEQREERKRRRTKDFEANRKEKDSSNSSTNSQKHETKRKLLEWKAEQEKKKKRQGSQKKPPFVVGIVRHRFYSPVTTTKNSVTITKKKTSAEAQKNSSHQKGITRATEKRLLSKIANVTKEKPPAILNAKKSPASENFDKRESFAPIGHKFNPPAMLPKLPLFGEVSVEDDLINKNIFACDNSTEKVIPVSSTNEFPTEDAIMKNIDMPMEKKEHTVEYFKHQLYKVRNRLQKHCEHWTEIQSRDDIIEDIRCRINQAVGQTTLLINKKFTQFHGLILACERGNADMPITCTDLHGFWDMMYIEVKDCDSRFAKLEELRARHWREVQSFFINSAKKGTDVKRQSVKQSLLQSSISADKKKRKMPKMRDNEEDSQQIINMNNESITPSMSDKKVVENIEKNLNVTRRKCCKDLLKIYANPMYTSTPLHNEDKSNSLNASLVTMKISQLYNKSTMHIDDMCILSEQTPRKSITEKSRKPKRSLRIKSECDADNNHLEKTIISKKQSDLETSQNSQVSLKKIDSFEFEKARVHELNERSRVERRLNYTTNTSFDSSFSTVIEKTIEDKNDDTLKSIWIP